MTLRQLLSTTFTALTACVALSSGPVQANTAPTEAEVVTLKRHPPIVLSTSNPSAQLGCDGGNMTVLDCNGKPGPINGSNFVRLLCPRASEPFEVAVVAPGGAIQMIEGGDGTPGISLGYLAVK